MNDEQSLAFEKRADRVNLGRFLRMNVFHRDLNDSFLLRIAVVEERECILVEEIVCWSE